MLVAHVDERRRPTHLDSRDPRRKHGIVFQFLRADEDDAFRHIESYARLEEERTDQIRSWLEGHRSANFSGLVNRFLHRGGFQLLAISYSAEVIGKKSFGRAPGGTCTERHQQKGASAAICMSIHWGLSSRR